MLDFSSKSKKAFVERMKILVDAGNHARNSLEKKRLYLGVSFIGHWCPRHVQYQYMAQLGLVDGRDFEARTLRIFQRGHVFEDVVAGWLRDAGFILDAVDPETGKQFEVSLCNGTLVGHADGIVTGIRNPLKSPVNIPALWEHKALGNKGFNTVKKNGIMKERPEYFRQMQCYMRGLNLNCGLFTATNMDTMELYHESVDFNSFEADAMELRAERVKTCVDSGSLMERGTDQPDFFKCKWCDFEQRCWKE